VFGQVDKHCKAKHVNREGRKQKRRVRMENISSESTEEGHCSKVVIEGLIYLKLTPVVIQSRKRSRDEWQPAGLGRQEKNRERATQSRVVRAGKLTMRAVVIAVMVQVDDCLKLTPVVIQSQNAAKMKEWQLAGLGRQQKVERKQRIAMLSDLEG
jgi:hypothetical protein